MDPDPPTPSPLQMPPRRSVSPTGFGDDVPVIRGGVLHPGQTLKAAFTSLVRLDRAGLSVAAGAVESHAQLLQMARDQVPHPQVSCTDVGRLRAAGFELEKTGQGHHYTVWLLSLGINDPQALTDAVMRFIACFDDARPWDAI